MARIRINTTSLTKEKPYMINSQFLLNCEVKKIYRVSKIHVCMLVSKYVCKWDMCWRNCLFHGDLKCEKRSFSNEHRLKFLLHKRKPIKFFRRKLSKLHKKRYNFSCDSYIFPKTRGNKNKQWTYYSALNGANELLDTSSDLLNSFFT